MQRIELEFHLYDSLDSLTKEIELGWLGWIPGKGEIVKFGDRYYLVEQVVHVVSEEEDEPQWCPEIHLIPWRI